MTVAALAGIAVVLVLAVIMGTVRPRRYTSVAEFYVAARAVRPLRNGAAIGAEFTGAAVCLGLAGLIATHGAPMLWYPVGAAAGFVVVLALVVAPLRRSGTFTLPDFAEWRLGSARLRRFTTCWVLGIGLLFLVAQFQAAGIVTRMLTGLPPWAGWAAVAGTAAGVALAGGMGSVTSVQASQFWVKLVAFLGVGLLLWCTWHCGQLPPAEGLSGGYGSGDQSLAGVLTVLLACALGTMGLPHVVVRVYAAPDGRGARRSIVAAQVLLGVFAVVPPLYGVLGNVHFPGAGGEEVVLLMPSRMLPGVVGNMLTGVLSAGAFAAFLATSCGVLGAVSGAVSACVARPGVRSFRASLAGVTVAALVLTATSGPVGSVALVLAAFSLSAATFCPLLVLGIWWRRLTPAGAVAGFAAGGGLTAVLVGLEWVGVKPFVPPAVGVPLAFAVMVMISLLTPGRIPAGVAAMMARMHLPEPAAGPLIDRSSREGDRSPS
ncbi:sodium:solute symporter family transporter [Nonomuraea endophytica]|uniref:Cation/acetate symporter n=1 Tax=Nonomuraea endophytica TaxID=714136 RepID=A0A7W8AH01_9ACTN|nr:cation acetate symporter [Nonomuraea endophytica]MBB5084951.1 cation/acetate symporter [Nonomuraea endophytica]